MNPVKSTEKQELTVKTLVAQNKTETYKMSWFERQIFFCKRAETVGVIAINTLNQILKRVWLAAIATILSKTFKIIFSSLVHTIDLSSP